MSYVLRPRRDSWPLFDRADQLHPKGSREVRPYLVELVRLHAIQRFGLFQPSTSLCRKGLTAELRRVEKCSELAGLNEAGELLNADQFHELFAEHGVVDPLVEVGFPLVIVIGAGGIDALEA